MDWFSTLSLIAVLTARAFSEQTPHTKMNYEQVTITMKTSRVTVTPSNADVAHSTDTNQDKVNGNTKYGRVTVTVHTKMSPNDLAGGTDLGKKAVKLRTGLGLEDVGRRKDLSPEDVALNTDVGLDDVTLHTDVLPEEVNIHTDVLPEEVTLHTDVLPEEMTLHMDVGLAGMTLHMDVGLDDVTLNTDVGLDDVTLNTVVGPEDVTLHTDVGPETTIVHREHNQDAIFRSEPDMHDGSIAIEPYHVAGNTLGKKTEKLIEHKHKELTNSERANKREMYDSEHNQQVNAPKTSKLSYSIIVSLFLATSALACVMVAVIFRRSKYFAILRRRWEHFNQSSYYPREYEAYHRSRMQADVTSTQDSHTTSFSSEEIDN